jgi:hypothetical protein
MFHKRKSRLLLLVLLLAGSVIGFDHNDLFTRERVPPETSFTGQEDHHITLSDAATLTFNFRMQAGPDAVLGGFFGKQAVIAILSQEAAVGLRYYYGLDDQGQPHLVLVGVDKNGDDMQHGLLAQRAISCPPCCARANELNSPIPQMHLTAGLE